MPKNELKKCVALSLAPGIGPRLFKKLLDEFGDIDTALEGDARRITQLPFVPKKFMAGLKSRTLLEEADKEIAKAKKAGAEIVSFFDERYPGSLKEIFDPPMLLYVKGRLPEKNFVGVGIVGSRQASLYGLRMSRKFGQELASAGVVVISGMALGIDGAAHEGALKGGGVTLAVLGSGLNKIYPPGHAKLAREIEKAGALISEYPMDMEPIPQNFPVRNRIISGLSQGVVIVEAQKKSGALITAEAALEQGREVFAVPGNADSAGSAGTIALLKDGAKMAVTVSDILEGLGLDGAVSSEKPLPALSEDENHVLKLVHREPHHVDELIEESQIGDRRTISALTMLEIKKVVKQLPGKNFVRVL